ncbi:queuine tRNA-ribosyltransferase [Reticulomyxa filosa]|uniref:Queuine tRNA-ribosyltransferase n=1 Tax=Reticulomyxa filosa TaxID=46433 RepID=X6NWV0_RETFI|nr:queuine tRNA-ribosyltransferase [Reticulomyxa filosa]|eukprot:ETO30795.1 queuine tRNA-ribosyltransferase [Reticulomyxa filosa]
MHFMSFPLTKKGGLCGGEAKNDFWKTVYQCTQILPHSKPRYVMGVGFPLDLVVCVALGADMFDCVYPCRTARFGTALVRSGELHLKSSQFKFDFAPIDDTCTCSTCLHYTRAYLHTVATKESTAASLLTVHNIYYLLNLMKQMRTHIQNGSFHSFVKEFMHNMFPNGPKTYPTWCIAAFHTVGIDFS